MNGNIKGFTAFLNEAMGNSKALVEAVTERGDLEDGFDDGLLGRVKSLLASGADPNSRDEEGVPVLAIAIENLDHETVELLVKAGADQKKAFIYDVAPLQEDDPDARMLVKTTPYELFLLIETSCRKDGDREGTEACEKIAKILG